MAATWRLGLTGGIGSGKSTVARMLVARGATLIDADAIARAVAAPGGAAIPAIVQAFGKGMLTAEGGLDRAQMRELVFSDPGAKQRLEHIIHPLVSAESATLAQAAEAAASPCLVFDIPLLVESGHWRAKLDAVWVVDCLPETQIARVMARGGLSREAVQTIIATQATRAHRLAAADVVLFNNGLSLTQLEAEVAQAAQSFGL